MKNCPKCGELLGEDVNECFKCHYNYLNKRVITSQEIRERREEKEREIQKLEEFEKEKEEQIKKNPLYEYKIEIINDLETGEVDQLIIQRTINKYSSNGWKLHTVFSNELGKNSTMSKIAFFGMSINATICQTVLIFERCVKA